MGVHCLVLLAAYAFLHLLVFNHSFRISCMNMVSFLMYVMANLKDDLFCVCVSCPLRAL